MITKRISEQQKQPGSFILQAEPLSRLYHVAESICRIYNTPGHTAKYGSYTMIEIAAGKVLDVQLIQVNILNM